MVGRFLLPHNLPQQKISQTIDGRNKMGKFGRGTMRKTNMILSLVTRYAMSVIIKKIYNDNKRSNSNKS